MDLVKTALAEAKAHGYTRSKEKLGVGKEGRVYAVVDRSDLAIKIALDPTVSLADQCEGLCELKNHHIAPYCVFAQGPVLVLERLSGPELGPNLVNNADVQAQMYQIAVKASRHGVDVSDNHLANYMFHNQRLLFLEPKAFKPFLGFDWPTPKLWLRNLTFDLGFFGLQPDTLLSQVTYAAAWTFGAQGAMDLLRPSTTWFMDLAQNISSEIVSLKPVTRRSVARLDTAENVLLAILRAVEMRVMVRLPILQNLATLQDLVPTDRTKSLYTLWKHSTEFEAGDYERMPELKLVALVVRLVFCSLSDALAPLDLREKFKAKERARIKFAFQTLLLQLENKTTDEPIDRPLLEQAIDTDLDKLAQLYNLLVASLPTAYRVCDSKNPKQPKDKQKDQQIKKNTRK
jgi:hypothetical protein